MIIFLLKVLRYQVFGRTLITCGFRCSISRVKLLVFRIIILLDTNTKILMITELRN